MSDEEENELEEQEEEEQEGAEEDAEIEETPEEVDEAPPEKEWKESIQFYAAFIDDKVVTVRVSETLNLPKWATEALSDSLYWMQKSIEKAKETDEPVNPNMQLTIESSGSGYFELREKRAEEAPEQEKEATGEEEEQEREAADDVEVPNPEIDVDLLTLVIEVSPSCAGYLISLENTSLKSSVEWCGSTLSHNKDYNTAFLLAIESSRQFNPKINLSVNFNYFFERDDKTEESYTRYGSLLQEWLSHGLLPDRFPSPYWLNSHHDINFLHKMLFLLPHSAIDKLCTVPEVSEDEEGTSEQQPFLPKYLGDVIKEFQGLSGLKFPKSLKIVCPTMPEISGVYHQRGKCCERPRYWYGDSVTTSVSYDITYSDVYGWRLSVVGGEALFSCGVSGSDLFPMMPDRWIHKSCQQINDKRELLFITPLNLFNIIPKLKHLEKSSTEDPIMSYVYTERSAPPRHLRLYFSDLLLLLLAFGVKYGLVVQLRRLLKYKTEKKRHVGEPTGFYHLLLMSVPKIHDESTVLGIFDLAPMVVGPLGLVELKPFLTEIVSSEFVSEKQLQYLLSLIYHNVIHADVFGTSKASSLTLDLSSFVQKAAEFNKQYEKAYELLIQNPVTIVEDLKQLVAAVPIRWNAHFMYKAVVANCITVVGWLLESGFAPKCQKLPYQVCTSFFFFLT